MTNTIKIGNLDISAFKVGSDDCKVYLGDTLLYPTTPTPSYKWLATYTGGTTSSAECDSTSVIVSSDIELTDLVSVEIGDCVTSISNSVFYGCSSLTTCTIGSGVTSIGNSVFRNCSGLTSIDIPNSVTSIGGSAFRQCTNLRSVTIGNGVTNIGNYAFRDCTNLRSVTIGNGVTNIETYAFRDCTNLQFVTIKATTPPSIRTNAFNNTNNCPIYVPSGSVDTYKAASGWSSLSSRIQAIPNS